MTSAADPEPPAPRRSGGRSSATSITDPTSPPTSLALDDDDDGVLLLDVTDTRVTTRATGIPRDIRQLVRDEELTRPSNWRAAVHSSTLVGLWATTAGIGLVVSRWWAWGAIWLAQLVIVRGAYVAMHDAAHGTLLRSRAANRLAGVAWSVPLLVNASLWRSWHLEHHRATVSDEDPEGVVRAGHAVGYLVAPPLRGLRRFVTFFGQSLAVLAGRPPAYARRFGPHLAMRVDALILALASAGLVAGVVLVPWLVVPVWVVPVLGYWIVGAPYFDLPEHHRTATRGGALDVSRTVGASRPTRWLLRNSNHHAAHHLVPSVSARQLPRLDEALADRTVHRAPSYLRHHVRTVATLLPGRPAA